MAKTNNIPVTTKKTCALCSNPVLGRNRAFFNYNMPGGIIYICLDCGDKIIKDKIKEFNNNISNLRSWLHAKNV